MACEEVEKMNKILNNRTTAKQKNRRTKQKTNDFYDVSFF